MDFASLMFTSSLVDYCLFVLQGYKALHSPYTGIVNWSLVAHSYAEDIQNAGGVIHTNFEVRR